MKLLKKNRHAVLDITPTAVDKLNYSQLYPIVIFLRAPSAKGIHNFNNNSTKFNFHIFGVTIRIDLVQAVS